MHIFLTRNPVISTKNLFLVFYAESARRVSCGRLHVLFSNKLHHHSIVRHRILIPYYILSCPPPSSSSSSQMCSWSKGRVRRGKRWPRRSRSVGKCSWSCALCADRFRSHGAISDPWAFSVPRGLFFCDIFNTFSISNIQFWWWYNARNALFLM